MLQFKIFLLHYQRRCSFDCLACSDDCENRHKSKIQKYFIFDKNSKFSLSTSNADVYLIGSQAPMIARAAVKVKFKNIQNLDLRDMDLRVIKINFFFYNSTII